MDIDAFKRPEMDRLIRYGYSGFLLMGILLFITPDSVRPVLQAGGAVVSPLVILAAGAAVYTLYRYVLNEMFLSPLVLHPLHSLIDRKRPMPTNPANFLMKEYKVPRRLGHDAYMEVRRGFFPEEQRLVFDRNHTEATIVWLTAVECLVAGCVLLMAPGRVAYRRKEWPRRRHVLMGLRGDRSPREVARDAVLPARDRLRTQAGRERWRGMQFFQREIG